MTLPAASVAAKPNQFRRIVFVLLGIAALIITYRHARVFRSKYQEYKGFPQSGSRTTNAYHGVK